MTGAGWHPELDEAQSDGEDSYLNRALQAHRGPGNKSGGVTHRDLALPVSPRVPLTVP